MNQEATRIILFDGVCNLCNATVQFIIRHDPTGKFKFASLQSERGQDLLRHHNIPVEALHTFFYIRNGKCFDRSSAALEIARDLQGGWKLLYIFRIIPRAFRDFVYNQIARRRYHVFGRRPTCMIPAPGLQDRFLS